MNRIFYHTLLLTGIIALPGAAQAQLLDIQAQPQAAATAQTPAPTPPAPQIHHQIVMSGENLSHTTIEQLQQALTQRGLYKGAITGEWNADTQAALDGFQQSNGEIASTGPGLVSSDTLDQLGITLKPTFEALGSPAKISRMRPSGNTPPVGTTGSTATITTGANGTIANTTGARLSGTGSVGGSLAGTPPSPAVLDGSASAATQITGTLSAPPTPHGPEDSPPSPGNATPSDTVATPPDGPLQ